MRYSKNNINKLLVLICLILFAISFCFGYMLTAKKAEATVYGEYVENHKAENIPPEWIGNKQFTPLDIPVDEDLQTYIYYTADAYNIDYTLVLAVIQKESNFNPTLVSTTDDYGLMQINKCNHAWLNSELGVTDFLNAEQNIHAGVYVLNNLFQKYGDTNKVLMAYNCGEAGAKALWKRGIYSTSYTRAVSQIQGELNGI